MMRNLVIVAVLMLCFSALTVAQELPQFEIFGGWTYLRADGGQYEGAPANGWNATVSINANDWFGVDIEGTGHYGSFDSIGTQYILPEEYGGENLVFPGDFTSEDGVRKAGTRSHSLAFGPRFTFRQNERYQPFYHALIGIRHSTGDNFVENVPPYNRAPTADELDEDPELTTVLVDEKDTWLSSKYNNFIMIFGGGLDIVVNNKWSVRAFQADYALERFRGDFYPDLRFAAGVIYKIGER